MLTSRPREVNATLRPAPMPFFILVSQEAGFVWRQQPQIVSDEPPTAAFPMESVLRHYARWMGPDEWMSAGSLELVVANWLAHLAFCLGLDLRSATDPLAAVI